MSFTVKIKEYELVGEHIEFIIEVTEKASGDSWRFLRRYSSLRDAHKQLKSLDSRVPEFPPKKMFGSKNPRFLETRRSDLEVYLNAITKIPKLIEHSFTKDLFKPSDSTVLKSTPVQNVTPYKKPKQGPEMQNFVNKLNDVVAAKFFDLSAQPVPPDEEDVKRQSKVFESLLKNIKVAENFKIPEGSHINDSFHQTAVGKQEWTAKGFEQLLGIIDTNNPVDLLISFR